MNHIKSFILCSFILIISLTKSQACNICGGSSGGGYLGILPQYYKNFIGLRYTSKSFNYSSNQLTTYGGGKLKSETFNTFELWGRVYLKKKLQLLYFVPYSKNSRYEEGRTIQIEGVGDLSVFLNYNLLDKTADSLKLKHFLMIGGGFKLPTGKFMQRDPNKTILPASFQVGTGGYAFQTNLIYTIRYQKIGLNNDINYRVNFENELMYKLGNQLNASSMLFFWQKLGSNVTLLPQSGVFLEKFNKDTQYDLIRENTGGYNLFYNIGVDIYLNRLVIGGLLLNPIVSNVESTLPKSKTRVMCNLSFLF